MIARRAAEIVLAAESSSPWLDTKGAAEHLCCSMPRIHDLVSPGNGTHGAYAQITEAELEGKVREVYDALMLDRPVQDDADAMVVRMLAENRVRRERVRDSEVRHGIEKPDGGLRTVVEFGF